jgi:uncharacterized protein (TIGR00266 family)
MKYEIIGKPDYPVVKIILEDQESIVAESGAMVSMSSNISIKTNARGGVFRSLKRMVFSGESFFQNSYTALAANSEIIFAPSTMGDLAYKKIGSETLFLSRGAYIAGSPELKIDSKWSGFKGLFGGEGFFFLKIDGLGDLFFSSFGAIEEINVNGEYIVDNGHIVGFEGSLDFSIERVGGLKSLLLSGEGLVCHFKGHGKVYIQSRNHNSFAGWANSFRRVESRS